MPRVASVTPLEAYQLEVTFSDGIKGILSLKDRLFGPMFEPLRDVSLFRAGFARRIRCRVLAQWRRLGTRMRYTNNCKQPRRSQNTGRIRIVRPTGPPQ